jgi:hypothetical protein
LVGGVGGGEVVGGEHGDGFFAAVHGGYGRQGDFFAGGG